MQQLKHLVELPYQHINRKQVGILTKKRIDESLPAEVVKLKIKRDKMLASISDDMPEDIAAELRTMIEQEWKVGKVEHSLTNGRMMDHYNPDQLLYADGTQHSEHSRSGLAEQLVDGVEILDIQDSHIQAMYTDGISNKNEIYATVDGELTTLQQSDYSLWDTIEQMGMLLVRTNAPWKSGRFDSKGWMKYNTRRKLTAHKRALGLLNSDVAQGDKVLASASTRRVNRLAKLRARKGGNLAKVGYNKFS